MNETGTRSSGSNNPRFMHPNPNLPLSLCQNCHQSLSIHSHADAGSFLDSGMQGSSFMGCGSVTGSTSIRMDHSFVVLPKKRNQAHSGKTIYESFVVLPPPAASVYSKSDPGNTGFHTAITILNRAFEIATSQMEVDHPICLECMGVLLKNLDEEVEDANRDIQAYKASLKLLEAEAKSKTLLSDAEFLAEKLKAEEEERKLLAAIAETEKQCGEVSAKLKKLELVSISFKEMEDRYWHEFNYYQLQLFSYEEERDAIMAKIEVSRAQLKFLTNNVVSDAFPIGCDGEFGTINNFRLGRLPKVRVKWDEINTSWGQACFLLHNMIQYFKPKSLDHIKILPMGSYPSIIDSDGATYEVFGPINQFWSTRYDKAMMLFLTCLKEFAKFAQLKDEENNIPRGKCFNLPYKIEKDKVGNYSIAQSFNKQENWTKALKYTLCNLKWALHWFVANTDLKPLPSIALPSTDSEMQS